MYLSVVASISVIWSELGVLHKGAGRANGSSSPYSGESGGDGARFNSPDEESHG
jgi:hypothetical protein